MAKSNAAANGENQHVDADPVSFARSYQLEALEKALKQNTIVFFGTGSGKTLIAIMLLRSYGHRLRKPSPYIAVFLVPTVVLVTQQGEVVKTHTDLKVGMYYGELGVDYWDAAIWKKEKDKYEVLVMTPQILLDALRHRFLSLKEINVLIFDECHNARGKHPYACIMTEFYHRELDLESRQLPVVFGMTASPIKAKASNSKEGYWIQIRELENLMHSKVYTCESNSVLTKYLPFSTPKLKTYTQMDIPDMTYQCLSDDLQKLLEKHKLSLNRPNISESVAKSAKKSLKKLLSTFMFCLTELGVWLAMKASEVYSRQEEDIFMWDKMDLSREGVVKAFSLDATKVFAAFMPSGSQWSVCNDLGASMKNGYLTSKVVCLVETLLEYRETKDLRCIVFVERIASAIVIRSLLNELLPQVIGWRAEYTAGNSSRLQSQSRQKQNAIVNKFRKGTVNIIIATSMLEEGLDVQSCNLVIRFDPSATICSFIQSRGRARMPNSDFILMVKRDDISALDRVKNYLDCGITMQRECLSHSHLPCEPLGNKMHGESWYEVESTGAIVTLRSSVSLLYFYCSRLPSDSYFKPYPYLTNNEELGSCTLYLPNSSPVRNVTVEGNNKLLKQLACLEACKKLHQVGALTDNLVPDIVDEEAEAKEIGSEPYIDEHAKYFPPELVGPRRNESNIRYECYLIELKSDFQYDVNLQDVVLAVHGELDTDLQKLNLDLDVDRGQISAHVKHVGHITLDAKQVALCQKFQITLFRLLLHHKINKLYEGDQYSRRNGSAVFNYLLLPTSGSHPKLTIDWKCVTSVIFLETACWDEQMCLSTKGHGRRMHTKNGVVCCCMLENSLICTPHNGLVYCITGMLDGFDGNTDLELRDGECITYKKYYHQRHGINLQFERETLLNAKRIFTVRNYLQRCRVPSIKEASNTSYELPPELCLIIMSPISVSTIYSFSFLPCFMHRIESLLIAANLKNIPMDHCTQDVVIPTLTVLEAITTKKCQEKLHLESLETLGDSFLKYATSQQLFKRYQNRHEGLLSIKREKQISNTTLCRLGCESKITGFIRNEPFDPKTWTIPGANCVHHISEEQRPSSKKVYVGGSRKIKSKTVADVVEALIGAFLTAGGEKAALSFMAWLGIDVDFVHIPYTREFCPNPEFHVNIRDLESRLNYSFRDVSLLVEALTHGSYMRPEIRGCYQRLEFLGDAVLDYLITVHLYEKHPGLSPGLLTDLRSASVNNDCYAQSAVKAGLHKHILHLSPELHQHINQAISKIEETNSVSTFGWVSETAFPKVLGDVIESLAGAIFVDSGYNTEIVFRSMRPLLEPLVTPETMKIHPVRELTELCQREGYILKKPVVSKRNAVSYVTVEVEARGVLHKGTQSDSDKKMAKRLAYKAVLKSLQESTSA